MACSGSGAVQSGRAGLQRSPWTVQAGRAGAQSGPGPVRALRAGRGRRGRHGGRSPSSALSTARAIALRVRTGARPQPRPPSWLRAAAMAVSGNAPSLTRNEPAAQPGPGSHANIETCLLTEGTSEPHNSVTPALFINKVWMVLESEQSTESGIERHSHPTQAGVSLRDWLLRSLRCRCCLFPKGPWCCPSLRSPQCRFFPFPRGLGVVPLSGALGVAVVAARGVLPIRLMVPLLGNPSHCSFSENKTRHTIFLRYVLQTSSISRCWYVWVHFVVHFMPSTNQAWGQERGDTKHGYFQVSPAYCSPDLR